MIIIIACVDYKTFGIGKDNKLLFDLKKDLAFFKNQTFDHYVVFGRETYEHLPIKPLPNRKNIVLSRNKDLTYDGCVVCNDIDEILKLAKDHTVYICGGQKIYEQFMEYADELMLTLVWPKHKVYPDTFFPMLTGAVNFNVIRRFSENDCDVSIVKVSINRPFNH